MRRVVAASIAVVVGLAAYAGCGSDSPEPFTVRHDAGSDDARSEADPAVDPTLGGPCNDDAQCDDLIPCTFDRCDQTLSRCRNTPDDSQCADDVYCNGREVCVLRRGCAPGPVVTCQDDNPCTIDRCIEATKGCEHLPRDSDGDGDPDDHCVPDKDCDDIDPTVSTTATEICGNLKDDDCDGQLDEVGCSAPANDVCNAALTVTGSGNFLLSTVATKKDYATSCSVQNPAAGRDVVVKITVPAGGGAKNVLVRARAYSPGNPRVEVAVAMQSVCGSAIDELACGHIEGLADARTIARNVAAGDSVYAIVTTQQEASVDLQVDLLAPGGAPANETCAAPELVTIDVPFTARIVDAKKDLASGCVQAKTGELTYSFTLATAQDVRIFASTIAGTGSGQPVITIRDGTCTGEHRCRVGSSPPVYARKLAAGTHVFTVAGTSHLDANVIVKTYPPTDPPDTQTCANPPPVTIDGDVSLNLFNHEDAIPNGCFPGGPAAVYKLDLAVASDVLVVGRFSLNEIGAVAINGPGCTTSDLVICREGQTPVRASKRNLPAGSYRVMIADQLGQNAKLSVFARPTLAPTIVAASDGCVSPLVIPETGGFYSGDTNGAMADFNASCDAPGVPLGGARDRLLRFDLSQSRRVVFDMSGSFLTTVLDIRKGAACPGMEIPGMCYVGFGPSRSFLDVTLTPGTHWVQIDGYGGEAGAFDLDVRVVAP